jgi:hypothetical protein
MMPFIQKEIHVGDPMTVGERTITPQSQAWVVRLPFGGLVWNRATAVLVTENNQTTTIPITDPTRLALWTLAGLVVMVTLLKRLR